MTANSRIWHLVLILAIFSACVRRRDALRSSEAAV